MSSPDDTKLMKNTHKATVSIVWSCPLPFLGRSEGAMGTFWFSFGTSVMLLGIIHRPVLI
jgi:hypothetical protein